jgi:uncharacterized protein (DUF2164 family)
VVCMNKKFEFDKESHQQMINMIKTYFKTERDEILGDIAAGSILTFFLEKLGPKLYNRGVADAHKYFKEIIDDVMEIQK